MSFGQEGASEATLRKERLQGITEEKPRDLGKETISKAKQVTANDNQVRAFLGTALVIRDSEKPSTATGNRAFSDDPKAQAIEISGPTAKANGNRVEKKSKK